MPSPGHDGRAPLQPGVLGLDHVRGSGLHPATTAGSIAAPAGPCSTAPRVSLHLATTAGLHCSHVTLTALKLGIAGHHPVTTAGLHCSAASASQPDSRVHLHPVTTAGLHWSACSAGSPRRLLHPVTTVGLQCRILSPHRTSSARLTFIRPRRSAPLRAGGLARGASPAQRLRPRHDGRAPLQPVGVYDIEGAGWRLDPARSAGSIAAAHRKLSAVRGACTTRIRLWRDLQGAAGPIAPGGSHMPIRSPAAGRLPQLPGDASCVCWSAFPGCTSIL